VRLVEATSKDTFRDKTRSRKTTFAALVGACVTVFVFVLYVRTLAPSVLYYERPILLDSVMYQVQAIVLGNTGPTGEPSWTMLTHLFTYLPLGDPGYRVNLASAVYGALAVAALFAAGWLLSRRTAAAAAGALAFGLGRSFWSQAVIAEIYTLNALLILLPIITLLVWREHRQDRYLLLASFLMGFAMTNHMTSGLVIPASFLFVFLVDRRKLLDLGLALKGVGLFLLGLTPYLYLPIRASMDPPINEADPTSLGRFWELVSGGGQQELLFQFGPAELPTRVMLYVEYLFRDFNLFLLMVALAGVAFLFFRDRAVAVFTGFLFFGWLFHALEYNIFDVELYFIPTYLMLCLWVTVGSGALLETAEDAVAGSREGVRRATVFAASALVVLLPLAGVWHTYAKNDMSDAYEGRETIEAVVENVEKGATVLHHRSELWYMVLVEKRRQDLTVIDPWPPGRSRYTDIVWPDDIGLVTTNLRYGTNDSTGVSTAKEAAEDGPVYILEQESAGSHNFYDAGFRTQRIEGELFELIPPGRETGREPNAKE
jgi:4-amino-4-deoxy-L-arabinose transferase-like glycosyltransferase